jgi:hypothetical protein
MSPNTGDRGIVLLCDREGTVQRVVRDDLGLSVRVHAGSHVNDLVDSGVREKIGGFWEELRTHQAAYNWEITVPVDGILLPLHFVGARLETTYLVVAARSHTDLAYFNEELARINNEQTNTLRINAKELSRAVQRSAGHVGSVYEELSKLNNEMVNLQREMAKKNNDRNES